MPISIWSTSCVWTASKAKTAQESVGRPNAALPSSLSIINVPFGGMVSRIAASARSRRNELLLKFISSMTDPTILDVGGTLEYWHDIPRGIARHIVLLNTFPQAANEVGFEAVVGDARDLSRFADGRFDLVFSNSVIGHVGGFTDQERMAREIRRVGKRYFVQTPNHAFPLDWRTLVPFFHLLPSKAQAWCFLHLPVGTYRRAMSEHEAWDWATRVRNLRRNEIELLFPGSYVLDERVLGLTKSFMIHNFVCSG